MTMESKIWLFNNHESFDSPNNMWLDNLSFNKILFHSHLCPIYSRTWIFVHNKNILHSWTSCYTPVTQCLVPLNRFTNINIVGKALRFNGFKVKGQSGRYHRNDKLMGINESVCVSPQGRSLKCTSHCWLARFLSENMIDNKQDKLFDKL